MSTEVITAGAGLAVVSVGVLVDNAREQVMVDRRRGVDPDVILVSAAAYAAVRRLKHAEKRRGLVLGLFGKRLRIDPDLRAEDVETAVAGT